MKISYVLATVLFITGIGSLSQADGCRDMYLREYDSIKFQMTAGITVAGVGAGSVGLAAIDMSGPVAAGATLAGGGTTAAIGLAAGSKLEELKSVIRLIDQSAVGIGIDLQAFADRVKLDTKDAAAAVLDLDSKKVLCASSDLLSSEDIESLVRRNYGRK